MKFGLAHRIAMARWGRYERHRPGFLGTNSVPSRQNKLSRISIAHMFFSRRTEFGSEVGQKRSGATAQLHRTVQSCDDRISMERAGLATAAAGRRPFDFHLDLGRVLKLLGLGVRLGGRVARSDGRVEDVT